MTVIREEIIIVGAGIAGLTAALALASRGARVVVLEQAEAIREFGAGLQVTPNGARVLRALGLGEALAARGNRAEAVELRDGPDDNLVMRLDLGRLCPDQEWRFFHRADLIAILADGARAAGVRIETGCRVESVVMSNARPRLRLADGTGFDAGLVIGADGVHSQLRGTLNGEVPASFTQRVAWRAMVKAEPSAPAVAEIHMGPGHHLVSYPLGGSGLRNIVAVEERPRWADEGWAFRDDPMELRLAFRDFGPRVQGWLEQVEEVWLWGLFRHPVARCWQRVSESGAVAILGDAAHPTLPFLAQGANLALEDAWVLARCLTEERKRSTALARYQAARIRRVRRVITAAERAGRIYHVAGPARWSARVGLRLVERLAPHLPLARFDWIHGHDVTAAR